MPSPQPPDLEALRASETRYRRLFETARDGMLILDADSEKITDCNPFSLELLGLSRDEVIGRQLFEIGLQPDAAASAKVFQSLRETGAVRFEIAPLPNEGSAHPELEIVANLYAEGEKMVAQCNIRDITQRRRSEAEICFQADLLGMVGEAIIATDLKGKVTFWNRSAQDIYGWTAAEAIGGSLTALILPPAAAHLAVEIRQKIARGQRWSGQLDVRCRDGSLLPTLVSNAPIYDSNGVLIGAVSVSTDISERKRLEDAQAQLVSLVESSSDAIFSAGLNGIILTWNRGAQALFGFSAEEALGCSLALIFPSDSAAQTAEILERIRRGEAIEALEMTPSRRDFPSPNGSGNSGANSGETGANRRRFPARDADSRQVSLSISPITDAAGTLIGASGIARDITELKRAGQTSRRNEKLYRALTSNFPNGAVYLLDLEGRFFLAEGRGLSTIGFSPETFLGKTLSEVFAGTPVYDGMKQVFDGALSGSESAAELEINGRFRSVRGVPVRDDGGEIAFVLAMSQDITDRRLAEVALAESEMRMRALVASMDEIVFQFDLDGTYLNIWTNDENRLARPKAEMLGKRNVEVVGETIARPLLDIIARIAAGGDAELLEYRVDVGAQHIWVASRLSPILNSDGSVHSVCMLTRNFTEKKRIEEELERSNREILTIWDSMSDAFYAVDLAWNFTRANAQAGVLMHCNPAELIGKNLWQEFPDAVNLKFYEHFHRAMREQVPVTFEEYFSPLEMWVELHIYPSKLGLSVYFRDISSRKTDEQKIRASEARFQGIVANVPGMVYQFVLHPDGHIEFPFVSEGSRELAGLEPDEIRANPMALVEILHPEDRPRYLKSVAESAQKLQPWSWEGRGKLGSGRIKWVQGVSRPRPMPDGSLLWDGLLIDVSARKEAEDERDRFFTLSIDMLAIVDSAGHFKRINPAFERVLGFSATELQSRPLFDWVLEDDRAGTISEFEQLKSGRAITNFVNRTRSFDGSVKWLSWHAVPFEELFYVAAHDITPLVQAETALRRANEGLEARVSARTTELAQANEELRVEIVERQMTLAALREAVEAFRQAKEEADSANNAKSEFLSRMSHELRTPLNAILGFGQILQSGPLSSAGQDHVQQILQGGWHLLDLINEVLDISRVEAGHLELALEAVSLSVLIQESCALVLPLAAQRNVRLDASEVANNDCYVIADRQRLKQVVINLLSNAIKYNRRGGQVEVTCQSRPDEQIRIAIRDTGPGISRVDQLKLFMPFERLQAGDSDIEGTGLGLVLSRRLVSAMGGTLEMDSEVGQGSVFWIDLPASSAPESDSASTLTLRDRSHLESFGAPGNGIAAPPLRTYTVLCIEDNIANLQLLEVVLMERPAITLLAASHGEAGLDLARGHDFDLILLDLDLPDIPGDEVLRQLQAMEKTREVPVVIVSADAMAPQIARLLQAGARDYLTKPIDIHNFLTVLDSILPSEFEVETDAEKVAQIQVVSPTAPPNLASEPMPSLRILVAEDNLVNQRIVRHQLQNLGHEATLFDNGYDIIEAWQTGDFDLILMDCHMPKLDGYATTREIRQQEAERETAQNRRIPIVALTANALAGDREKSLAAGMDDHLSKPIKQAKLEESLRRWTSKARATPRVAASTAAPPVAIEVEEAVLQAGHLEELERELDAELLGDLVQIFLTEAPRLIAELEAAVAGNDAHEAKEIAHKFKGSCATMGVSRMASLCRAMEKSVGAGEMSGVSPQIERLKGEFEAAEAALAAVLARLGQ